MTAELLWESLCTLPYCPNCPKKNYDTRIRLMKEAMITIKVDTGMAAFVDASAWESHQTKSEWIRSLIEREKKRLSRKNRKKKTRTRRLSRSRAREEATT